MKTSLSLVIAALIAGSTILQAQEVTESAPPPEPVSQVAKEVPAPTDEKHDQTPAGDITKPEEATPATPAIPATPAVPAKPVVSTHSSGQGSFQFKFEPGQFNFNLQSDGPVHFTVESGFVEAFWLSPFMLLWRSGLLILWVALSSATAALFQPAILRAQAELQAAPGRSAALGFLWLICFWMLLVAGLVMALVLIGLPFILVLVAFDLALRVFGLTVTFAVVGQWIARRLNRPGVSIYAAVFIGACALGLLRIIPIAGSVIWFAAALFGVGATLAARFGTANNPPALSYPTGAAPLTA